MLSRTADKPLLARALRRTRRIISRAIARTWTQRLATLCRWPSVGPDNNEWESAVATAGLRGGVFQPLSRGQRGDGDRFSVLSTANPSSQSTNCFEVARAPMPRRAHHALTVEMWDAINGTWLELKAVRQRPDLARRSSCGFRSCWVQENSLRFYGSA